MDSRMNMHTESFGFVNAELQNVWWLRRKNMHYD